MVIFDWAKTPIYYILTKGIDTQRAILKFCNRQTL